MCDKPDGDSSCAKVPVNAMSGFHLQCSRLQQVLASRSESVIGDALKSMPVPVAALRIVRSESGLRLRVPENNFSRDQETDLMNYVNVFINNLPPVSLAERLEVAVRWQTQYCMTGAQALPVKQRRLRALGWLRLWLLRRQSGPAGLLRQQQLLLSCLFHEPERKIRSLWREHLFWFHFNYARRLMHLENRTGSVDYLKKFVWPDKADYRRVTQNNSASRVLLSIHMGDFFGAFRALSDLSGSGRQVISLRRDRNADHGMQHFSAERITHQVVYHDQQHAAAIVGALRRGHHTLATLFDLRDDFGSTVVVDFFGQPARFVKGPAQLAIMGRCQIFPFVCFEHQGRHCIEMAPVIDTRLREDECLHRASVRITQALVNLAEGWIRRWPAQWKYLPVLPAYFEVPY